MALAGRYRYLRELGAGGGGRVVAVEDALGGSATQFAHKLVSADAFARLMVEAEGLRRVVHPRVVRLIELLRAPTFMPAPWSLPRGAGVLVESLAPGKPSAEVFSMQPDGEARRRCFLRFAAQLADALASVHRVGLVHGDIKPANVLIDAGHGGSGLTLVDFGCASAPQWLAPTISGTPAFFAPECRAGTKNFSTDLFALGRTFQVWLEDSVEGLPAPLRGLLDALLASDAAERPASADARVARLVDLGAVPPEVAKGSSKARAVGEETRASAPSEPSRRAAFSMPFVDPGSLGALEAELAAGQPLVVVCGPRGAGRTRLLTEAVLGLQRTHAKGHQPVPTFALLPDGPITPDRLPEGPFVGWRPSLRPAEARRLIEAAEVRGHTCSLVTEVTEEDWPEWEAVGATRVEVGPLDGPAFDTLYDALRARLGPAATLSRHAAQRQSGALAGRLCRLFAEANSGEASTDALLGRSSDAIGEVGVRLALAGGQLSQRALGHAAQGMGRLMAEGLVTLSADGTWSLRDDLLAPLLADVPSKRRAAIARNLQGETPRQRAHLAHHRGEDATGAFEVAVQHALAAGRVEAASRLGEEAQALGVSSVVLSWHHAEALALAGRYDEATTVVPTLERRARLMRMAGKGAEAEALLDTTGAVEEEPDQTHALQRVADRAHTRGWLALAQGLLSVAYQHAGNLTGGPRAELLAWCAMAEGRPDEAVRLMQAVIPTAPPSERPRLYVSLGVALRSQPKEARVAFQEGLSLAQAFGARHLEATLRGNLGAVLLSLGELGPAQVHLKEAARSLLWLGRARDAGRALYNLAMLEMTIGAYGDGELHLHHAARQSERAADGEGIEMIRVGLAERDALRGDLNTARDLASTLTSLPAQERLASTIAGAAPDLALTLLSKARSQGESSAERLLAQVRALISGGDKAARHLGDASVPTEVRVNGWLQALEARGEADWDIRLRTALLQAEVRHGEGQGEALRSARTLLDLATASLDPSQRAAMRRVPAYERALSVRPERVVHGSSDRWRRLVRRARAMVSNGFGGETEDSNTPSEEVHRGTEESTSSFAREKRDSLESPLRELAQAALGLVDAERACVVARRKDGAMDIVASAGLVAGAPDVSRTVVSRALDGQAVVATTDALADEHLGAARIHAMTLRSLLCVPLPRHALALYVEDRMRPAAFGEEDGALLADLAALSAALLERHAREGLLRMQNRQLNGMRRRLERTNQQQAQELYSLRQDRLTPVTESASMRSTLSLCQKVAPSDAPVLLVGEAGTGKGAIARLIHRLSGRAEGPWVAESCAAIPESLMESVLFGHERGAFTGAERARAGLFEMAQGGTLLLEDVGEMSPAMQAAILRVVQEREVRRLGATVPHPVDVRLIATTQVDLAAAVEAGRFREDLFYRLQVLAVPVPPLRDRRADIPVLVRRWFEGQPAAIADKRLTSEALAQLSAHEWPGNLRQLHGVLERAALLGGDQITPADLPFGTASPSDASSDLKTQVAALERRLIEEALEASDGNLTHAATALGVSRYGLQKMIKRLGVERTRG